MCRRSSAGEWFRRESDCTAYRLSQPWSGSQSIRDKLFAYSTVPAEFRAFGGNRLLQVPLLSSMQQADPCHRRRSTTRYLSAIGNSFGLYSFPVPFRIAGHARSGHGLQLGSASCNCGFSFSMSSAPRCGRLSQGGHEYYPRECLPEVRSIVSTERTRHIVKKVR